MKDVYKRCGMVISQLQESFWRQKEKRGTTMPSTKRNSMETNTNKKIHAARFETVQQERQNKKPAKNYGTGVLLTEEPEATTTTIWNANAQCILHCGRNDHLKNSRPLCPFFQGKVYCRSTCMRMLANGVPANTPKIVHVHQVWPD